MKPLLKPILGALAGASLRALPWAAAAQQHGGGGHGGGFHGGGFHGGGFHGGGFHGGGFHGGSFHGGGRGGYYYGGGYPFVGGLGLGLALGAVAAPWPYYDGYYPGYAYAPYDPYYAYDAPPPPAAGPPAACGNWSWDASQNRYDWIPC